MKAIVPHKDTLFFLAGIQKKIISLLGKETLVYPQYPLYAFTDESIPSEIISCIIGYPKAEKELAVFPISIEGDGYKLNLSIPFARTAGNTIMPDFELPEEIKNAFPKQERIFRTATAIKEDNSWQLFDDKWNKIKK